MVCNSEIYMHRYTYRVYMDNVSIIDLNFHRDKRKHMDFDLNGYTGIHYQYVKIQIVGYIVPLLNFFH